MNKLDQFNSEAIATASSNEFFPWLLNLLGSIQANYRNHPKIFVYDLGMRKVFIDELKAIRNVVVKKVPAFVPHWRKCYTWKQWVLNDVPADIVYYLDAGAEVLRSLEGIFDLIKRDGYFCASQLSFGPTIEDIVPLELLRRLGMAEDFFRGKKEYFTAGGFGYKKGTIYHECVKEALDLAKEGWALGWSISDQHRNKDKDFCDIIRDCNLFRHDQTLLNVLFYKKCGNFNIQDESIYSGFANANLHPLQVIWASRRLNKKLQYLNNIRYKSKPYLTIFLNRLRCQSIIENKPLKWILAGMLAKSKLGAGKD